MYLYTNLQPCMILGGGEKSEVSLMILVLANCTLTITLSHSIVCTVFFRHHVYCALLGKLCHIVQFGEYIIISTLNRFLIVFLLKSKIKFGNFKF